MNRMITIFTTRGSMCGVNGWSPRILGIDTKNGPYFLFIFLFLSQFNLKWRSYQHICLTALCVIGVS